MKPLNSASALVFALAGVLAFGAGCQSKSAMVPEIVANAPLGLNIASPSKVYDFYDLTQTYFWTSSSPHLAFGTMEDAATSGDIAIRFRCHLEFAATSNIVFPVGICKTDPTENNHTQGYTLGIYPNKKCAIGLGSDSVDLYYWLNGTSTRYVEAIEPLFSEEGGVVEFGVLNKTTTSGLPFYKVYFKVNDVLCLSSDDYDPTNVTAESAFVLPGSHVLGKYVVTDNYRRAFLSTSDALRFNTATVYDLEDVSGQESMTINYYGKDHQRIGSFPKKEDAAFRTFISVPSNGFSQNEGFSFFKREDQIWDPQDTGFYFYLGPQTMGLNAFPWEKNILASTNDLSKLTKGGRVLLEFGAVKCYAGEIFAGTYVYAKLSGAVVAAALYKGDVSRFGDYLMAPYMDSTADAFTLSSAKTFFHVTYDGSTEGISCPSSTRVSAGDSPTILVGSAEGLQISDVLVGGVSLSKDEWQETAHGIALSLPALTADAKLSFKTIAKVIPVSVSAPEEVHVSSNLIQGSVGYNGTAVFTIAPALGSAISALTANGVSCLDRVSYSQGLYTLTLPNIKNATAIVLNAGEQIFPVTALTEGKGTILAPTSVAFGGQLEVQITPEVGHFIASVSVNGEPASVSEKGVLLIKHVQTALMLKAVFVARS